MAFSKNTLEGVPLTRANFTDPPREMGILPFWFWNGAMDEQEMEWQLKEYKSKGIPGIFNHGRFGLKVPYVSDAWFEKVKIAVAKAREIGIDAWVYDEMNWPSGTAERKVPKQFPHLTQKYLELVALNVDGPLFTFLEATDNRYVNTGDSYPIAAFGCTEEEYQGEIKHPIDLTPNLSFERVIPWEAPAGKWRLLYFLEKEVPYYIDTLNPESTNRFIELTYERYKQAVGADFGSVVPGFYTDEPAMHYYHVGIDNFVIPWTGQMFKIFRQRRGYDLRPWLPALYANMGPRTAGIRYDFWRTLTEQYAETYYKRLHDWCEENGLIFTGHLLFEEWIRLHARCEGNLFKYLQHMHLIGVDHLYPKVGTREEPDQHVALKIASSAAHHFGSTRLLCESMGGSYWDCTLHRMKWIANWEYVLGVNLFNNHGYHYSIEGERKRDWPPSQFYHHTWWDYYPQFTTYMARISHLLSGGSHVAKLLVLYPLTSIWANYVPQQRDAVGNVLVRKRASPGREDRPALALQAHLDMVCEKNEGTPHDFARDPIDVVRDGDVLRARGTTLGADNGIGVATALAVLAARDLAHPAIEALFTVDEETGLTGANGLRGGWLRAERLLNLDSEEEGELTIGCAGGVDSVATRAVRWEPAPAGGAALRLRVLGLKGGHSGIDIGAGRGNALRILGQVLHALAARHGLRLGALKGGNKRNAIAREASALVVVEPGRAAALADDLARLAREWKAALGTLDHPSILPLLGHGDSQQQDLGGNMKKELSANEVKLLLARLRGCREKSRLFVRMVKKYGAGGFVLLIVLAPMILMLPAILVLAFYYTWFDENSWAANRVPDTPQERYVSRDRNVMGRQIEQAKAAGIDAFVVSWYGPRVENNQTETNLRALLDETCAAENLQEDGGRGASQPESLCYVAPAELSLRLKEENDPHPLLLG